MDTLVNLFAQRLISRPDVKAVQHSDGSYHPERTPWSRADLEAHIAGTKTFGHYLLNTDDTCKIFCFDIDLRSVIKAGPGPTDITPDGFLPTEGLGEGEIVGNFLPADPRAVWADRADQRRSYLKYSMRLAAAMFTERIWGELEIPVAAAYSGSKGVHVYGLLGDRTPASDAREGAMIVLDSMGIWEGERGESLFRLKDRSNIENPLINFSVEVYPKQASLDGKDLGNLLRLPLGRNHKSADPTFFLDQSAPLAEMRSIDPEWALTSPNPWKRPGE